MWDDDEVDVIEARLSEESRRGGTGTGTGSGTVSTDTGAETGAGTETGTGAGTGATGTLDDMGSKLTDDGTEDGNGGGGGGGGNGPRRNTAVSSAVRINDVIPSAATDGRHNRNTRTVRGTCDSTIRSTAISK